MKSISAPSPSAPVALAAAVLAALAIAAPASGAPAVDGVSAVTGSPQYLALGPDGNVWTPLSGAPTNEIARITPAGTVTEYDVAELVGATGIVSDSTSLWVTKSGGVAKFDPANPAGATSFAVAGVTGKAITKGSDGNLWTGGSGVVLKIPPADPATFTSIPVVGLDSRGITAGGDGALYLASFGDQRIYRVTTAGVATSVDVGGGPQEVAAGPGTQIAFANPTAVPQVVGRLNGLTPLGETPMPTLDPFGMVLGNDGAYWIARFAAHDVARMTTDGIVTSLPGIPALSGPRQITKGPGDTLFVGLQTANKVARITGVSAPVVPPSTPPVTTTGTGTTGTGTTGTGATGTSSAAGTKTQSDLAAITVSKLRLTTTTIKRGSRLPALTSSKKGSQLRFTTSGPATVTFRFARRTPGRRVGGACVKQTSANASSRRCQRDLPVSGSFSLELPAAGDYRVRFDGRLTTSRSLRPGTYRAFATASSAGATTPQTDTTSFSVRAP